MKKATKVVLIVLALLVAAIGAVVIWQWDNIKAVKTSFTHSREDLAVMMAGTYQAIEDATEDLEGVTVRDMTQEERTALRAGELSREELILRLISKQTPGEEQTAQDGESAAEAAEQSGPVDPDQKLLSEYLAEIYVMKDEYTAWLEAKYNEAIDAYNALPKEQQTPEAKYSIGMERMKQALAKEDECDAAMKQIEQKIGALLAKMGRDDSLVKEIQKAYEQEKELKKAYYLGLHN